MKYSSLCVLSAVGMLCLATGAKADSITFSASTPTAPFSAFPVGGAFTETAILPQFNPGLGTLHSIDFTLEAVGATPGWGLNVFNPFISPLSASGVVGG